MSQVRPTTAVPPGATPARVAPGCRCGRWPRCSPISPSTADRRGAGAALFAIAQAALAGGVVPHPLRVADLGDVVHGEAEALAQPLGTVPAADPAPGP